MEGDREYCSELSRTQGEPMLGTAEPVDIWLLLEYKPAWKSRAVEDNGLEDETNRWLEDSLKRCAERGLKARPQFIRRPDFDLGTTTLFIARNNALGRIEASEYDAIREVDVLTSDLAPVRENVYFVCTNGQRDLCCARYGLPTFARLQELVGARVWQTTHLGGHRFAPNVLALPQGILYGRVDVDVVDAFVTTIESGDVSRSHVRGRSAFPPEAQFAEMQVAGRVEALLDIRDDRVRFRTNLGEEEVQVRSASIPMQIVASCGDAESEDVYPISGTA